MQAVIKMDKAPLTEWLRWLSLKQLRWVRFPHGAPF